MLLTPTLTLFRHILLFDKIDVCPTILKLSIQSDEIHIVSQILSKKIYSFPNKRINV